MAPKAKELEREIEILREKLYRDNPFQGQEPLNSKTYALSVRLDKLIFRYHKLKKGEGP